MARKQAHEEHQNHEAWAIPYGDLITLLLAFFVVMYAVSSINEGKYRVLADAMAEAFGGPPKTLRPVQVGRPQLGTVTSDTPQSRTSTRPPRSPPPISTRIRMPVDAQTGPTPAQAREMAKLRQIADDVQKALAPLIDQDLVIVRRTESWVEIEIKTDILFASGSARIDASAVPVLAQLSDILAPHANRVRIEGHTDSVPIATAQFPSNWELSAARAASVLRILTGHGVDPQRLSVLGFAEQRPRAGNDTPEGRNANRRVVLVLLSDPLAPEAAAAGS
jgi:chemotaxis protein MotB